jgi:hypothetical protein
MAKDRTNLIVGLTFTFLFVGTVAYLGNRAIDVLAGGKEVVPVTASLADKLPDAFARAQCSGLMSELAKHVRRNTQVDSTGDVHLLIQASITACQDVNESTGWEIGPSISQEMEAITTADEALTVELREKFAVALDSIATRIME